MKEKTVWFVRPSDRSRRISSKLGTSHYNTPKEAARAGLRGPVNFDIYMAKVGKRGEVVSSRKVISSYPGRAPEDWFPHKYGPAAVETDVPQHLVIQDRIPVGVADSMHAFIDTTKTTKRPNLFKNEIEMALMESDLTAKEVATAMGMFPNIDQIFGYLEKEGQKKTIHLISRILSW